MAMNSVIKPNVINILGSAFNPTKRTPIESVPPAEAKVSMWKKAKEFLKKSWNFIKSALVLLPPVLNAISRFKESSRGSSHKSHDKVRGYSRCFA